MLSFPAQNWDKALSTTRVQLRGYNKAFGRVASEINPRLYLSDYWTARDAEKLAELGITHVISVIDLKPDIPEVIPHDQRLHIPIVDNSDADIREHLDTTTAFIASAFAENETNKVLVHCMQGISRSATVVCAYLVATTSLTSSGSIAHVQSLRGIVCPNMGFRRQLDDYATQFVKLKKCPSQISIPAAFRLSGGIIARIKSFKSTDGLEKAKSIS
ncbi:hypothetical protein NLJ89_g302 [Agrocybe chaxingu]|uniref:Protein-tyrosine-phosphatase n=1 Tax=Agrocybe chaxingu TaxID=84603 RepID=A0A9W8TGM7_9AGAR|nr:hypothetical protein NLJ89_g302 [Agrocybe chaxingu]